MNSDPWIYVIYVGIGYLDNHVVSSKLAVDIVFLSSYCVISNHHVTGSITVMDIIFNFFLPFLLSCRDLFITHRVCLILFPQLP